jgi:2-oxoglutarate ferredoxin oxidoreductase subunit gamma
VPVSPAKVYTIPITEATKKQVGSELGLNIVAMGVVCALTGIVTREALKWAVLQRAPRGTEEYNKEALELGFSLGDEFGD